MDGCTKTLGVHPAHAACDLAFAQMNSRQRVEASLRQLERERALLQLQSAENLRKVETESDRKRSLENECMCLNIRFETPESSSVRQQCITLNISLFHFHKVHLQIWSNINLILQFLLPCALQYILFLWIYADHHWVNHELSSLNVLQRITLLFSVIISQ